MAVAVTTLATVSTTTDPYVYTLTTELPADTQLVFVRNSTGLLASYTDSGGGAGAWQDEGNLMKSRYVYNGWAAGNTITISGWQDGLGFNTRTLRGLLLAVTGGDWTDLFGVPQRPYSVNVGTGYGTSLASVNVAAVINESPETVVFLLAYITWADVDNIITGANPPSDAPTAPTGWTQLTWSGRNEVETFGPPWTGDFWEYGYFFYLIRDDGPENYNFGTPGLNFSGTTYGRGVQMFSLRGTPTPTLLPAPSETDLDNAADYAVMLAHTPEGHLLRCYRAISGTNPATGTVLVGVSRDLGATWTDVTVNPDAGDAAGGSAVPQILVMPDGTIFTVWHTSGDQSRCFFSTDDGATWTERAWNLTNCRRPAIWQSQGRIGLVYQRTTDDAWVTVRSDDLFETAPTEVSTLTGIPRGLPRVWQDQTGTLILVYAKSGMTFVSRPSGNDGTTWGSETDLGQQGYFPTVANGGLWGQGALTYGPSKTDVQRTLYEEHPWASLRDDPQIALDDDLGLTTVGTWVGMVYTPDGTLFASAKDRTPAVRTYWLDESQATPVWTEIV